MVKFCLVCSNVPSAYRVKKEFAMVTTLDTQATSLPEKKQVGEEHVASPSPGKKKYIKIYIESVYREELGEIHNKLLIVVLFL